MNTLRFIKCLAVISAMTISTLVFASNSPSFNPYELYGQWPADNNTSANLGVATTDRILNPSNVAQLQPLFSTVMYGLGTASDSTPTIADGNVYYSTGGGMVYSYTESGQFNWSRQLYNAVGGPESFAGSPVLTQQYLFIAGQQMHKLNRLTGQEVVPPVPYDASQVPFMPATVVAPSQVMVAGNVVIYGVGFTDETDGINCTTSESVDACAAATIAKYYPHSHGEIVAFNQDNLSVAWRIEPSLVNGFLYGAGAGSFGQGGVDESRHLYFQGSSNEYQPPVSPLSDSLLAIDYRTGKIVWSYQYAHGDYYGEAGSFLPTLGQNDLDVHGHPQIFSLELIPGLPFTSIDLVGARGKDGTYRIFTRDQIPGAVEPIAQIQVGPATAATGGIQADPTINNGILYIDSTSYITAAMPNVDQSEDFAVQAYPETYYFYLTTRVRAIDLRQLIYYGIGQLLKGNKTPICVGTIDPSNRCTGQLPANIILWQTALTGAAPTSSSGMTYDNGVVYLSSIANASFEGGVYMLNAANGSVIGELFPSVGLSFPVPGVTVVGGASIDNGKVFIPAGVDYFGTDLGVGGMTAFALPH